MEVRILPPVPTSWIGSRPAAGVVVAQRSEYSDVTRGMSVRLRSTTPARAGTEGWQSLVDCSCPENSQGMVPPGFESQALLHHLHPAAVAQWKSSWLLTGRPGVRILP